MPIPDIRLDHNHVYWRGNVRIPGVTELLKPLVDLGCISAEVLEAASARGTDVHTACHLDDLGVLNEATITGEVQPYLNAYRKFKTELRPEILASEELVFHPTQAYAGTLDKRMVLRARKALVDIKSGVLHAAVGLQTAAYELAYRAMTGDPSPWDRFALQLRRDGTYKLTPYQSTLDGPTFLGLCSVHRWRQINHC